MPKLWDLVVIGGGPAGLSAAIYSARDEQKVLVLEKHLAGGMMSATAKVDNYPGFLPGASGFGIGQSMLEQAEKLGAKIEYKEAKDIKKEGKNWSIVLENNSEIRTRTILIATGTKYRHLNIEGESEMIGRGVHFCATCDGAFYKDKNIAVIGGGNSAIEEATFLTKFAKKIYLIVREKITASDGLIKEMQEYVDSEKIEIILNSDTKKIINQDKKIKAIEYSQNGKYKKLEVEGVFVFIGLLPNVDFIKTTKFDLDDYGFIKIDENNMTNQEGIFACGDITSNAIRQIATASADGIKALLKISKYLK